jgi:hypothetical protein
LYSRKAALPPHLFSACCAWVRRAVRNSARIQVASVSTQVAAVSTQVAAVSTEVGAVSTEVAGALADRG